MRVTINGRLLAGGITSISYVNPVAPKRIEPVGMLDVGRVMTPYVTVPSTVVFASSLSEKPPLSFLAFYVYADFGLGYSFVSNSLPSLSFLFTSCVWVSEKNVFLLR